MVLTTSFLVAVWWLYYLAHENPNWTRDYQLRISEVVLCALFSRVNVISLSGEALIRWLTNNVI